MAIGNTGAIGDTNFDRLGHRSACGNLCLQVVIVGNGAVGKSSMIQRFCKGTYTRDYKKTIGVDFLEREIEVDGEDVRLMLWDTAGQEEFDAITAAYYRGAHACVLAYSATDRDSFDAIPSWKLKVRLSYTRDIHIVLNRCKHVSVDSHDGWWNVKVKVPLKQGADFKSLHG
ncbi:Ras- protein Rab-23 [Melipona bicolor]|uniref:Ras- protein Rab-23 n=1 Tax=Melipona bicolor TaxID=60889 RepID=A0AA40FMX5_9HYME|nr:Ras- protein Rab-23 [Melipona bicolor]